MTYLDRINTFNLSLLEKPVSPNARSLYYQLLDLNNSLGWRESFSIANNLISSKSGLSLQQMLRARQELIDNKYIKYTKSKHSSITGTYKIIILNEYRVEYQKIQKNNTQTETNSILKPKPNRTQPDTQPETLNREDKIREDKNNKKETIKEKKTTETKKRFGEFDNVLLTQKEYDFLIIEYSEPVALDIIEQLSSYIESKRC